MLFKEEGLQNKMAFYKLNLGYQPKLNGNLQQKLMLKIVSTTLSEEEKNMHGMENTLDLNLKGIEETN